MCKLSVIVFSFPPLLFDYSFFIVVLFVHVFMYYTGLRLKVVFGLACFNELLFFFLSHPSFERVYFLLLQFVAYNVIPFLNDIHLHMRVLVKIVNAKE